VLFARIAFVPPLRETSLVTTIEQAESDEQIEQARTLFREYEAWLGVDLCFQGFEAELASLPGKYAPPGGRLLLAYVDGEPSGCVALRPLGDDVSEMKRLYLRDTARGHGLGVNLIDSVISEARNAGYSKLRLDSWPPKMAKAIGLYRSRGFIEIPAYYDNPYEVIFMELDLKAQSSSSAGPNR
jgi:GNAT superfamily N-acetyltransferase